MDVTRNRLAASGTRVASGEDQTCGARPIAAIGSPFDLDVAGRAQYSDTRPFADAPLKSVHGKGVSRSGGSLITFRSVTPWSCPVDS